MIATAPVTKRPWASYVQTCWQIHAAETWDAAVVLTRHATRGLTAVRTTGSVVAETENRAPTDKDACGKGRLCFVLCRGNEGDYSAAPDPGDSMPYFFISFRKYFRSISASRAA